MKSGVKAALLLACLVLSAAAEPRKLLEGGTQSISVSDTAEHQRILAELEEVHQLRERMLQQGDFPSVLPTALALLAQSLPKILTFNHAAQCKSRSSAGNGHVDISSTVVSELDVCSQFPFAAFGFVMTPKAFVWQLAVGIYWVA